MVALGAIATFGIVNPDATSTPTLSLIVNAFVFGDPATIIFDDVTSNIL